MQKRRAGPAAFLLRATLLQLLSHACSWWPLICGRLSATWRTVTQLSACIVLFPRPGGVPRLLERCAKSKIFLIFRACYSLGVKRRSGGAAFCAQVWRIGLIR